MAVDAYGLPIDFEVTGGEVPDCKVAPEFIEKLPVANSSSQIKVMTAKNFAHGFGKNHLHRLTLRDCCNLQGEWQNEVKICTN